MTDDDYDALVAAQRLRAALAAQVAALNRMRADDTGRVDLAMRQVEACADYAAVSAIVRALTRGVTK